MILYTHRFSQSVPSDIQGCLSLQHLTTFIMDRKDAMITIEDGIRKLRLLDAKGKVWTQEMLLQVDEKAVSLIDPDTKVRKTNSESDPKTLSRESTSH